MKNKKEKFNSGLSPKSNMSYEKYLKIALDGISPKLTVRTYKLAPKADYPIFERGKDLRVQVFWEKESKYEFIIEQMFWYQSNRNKEDREWMREHADVTLKMFKEAVKRKPKKKTKKKSTKKVKKAQGFTQDAFEKMKSK
tara:strand:- start:448 stop:867 length:420 start_codon:yes stop_codon:yes gene_type:complete